MNKKDIKKTLLFPEPFTEFLREMMFDDGPEYVTCKESFEDDFEDWINSLDRGEIIEYANKYVEEISSLNINK